MDFNVLSQYVAFLAIISASAERLVEAIKNIIGSFGTALDQTQTDPAKESKRKLWILSLSYVCCYITACLSLGLISGSNTVAASSPLGKLAGSIYWSAAYLGLLAMGGSSFWNSIQGYLNGLKTSIQAIAKAQEKASQQ